MVTDIEEVLVHTFFDDEIFFMEAFLEVVYDLSPIEGRALLNGCFRLYLGKEGGMNGFSNDNAYMGGVRIGKLNDELFPLFAFAFFEFIPVTEKDELPLTEKGI